MSSKARRAMSLPPPPPSPPLSAGSISPSLRSFVYEQNDPCGSLTSPNDVTRQHEIVIGKDLCRAIRELQAVPSLKWPTRSVQFYDFSGFAVDDDCVFVNRLEDQFQDEQLEQLERRRTTQVMTNGVDHLDFCNGKYSSNIASTSSIRTSSSSGYTKRTTSVTVTRVNDQHVGCHGTETLVPGGRSANGLRSESQTSDYGSLRRLRLPRSEQGWNSTDDHDRLIHRFTSDVVETVQIDDGVWNGGHSRTLGNKSVDFNVERTSRDDDVERFTVLSGTAVASISEFSDDYDIYEKQMDELEQLERGTITDTDDDYDAAVDDERCAGSYTIGLDGLVRFDGRQRSLPGSGTGSGSNFGSDGIDVIAETDWTSPADNINMSDLVDWEDVVSGKEKFVRNVLITSEHHHHHQQQQQQPEGNNVDEHRPTTPALESFNDSIKPTVGPIHHDTSIEEAGRLFCVVGGEERRDGSDEIRPALYDVQDEMKNDLNRTEDVGTASVFEQRSTITKTTLVKMEQDTTTELRVSTAIHHPAGEPTAYSCSGAVSDAALASTSVRYQLNLKPEKVKAISLASFVTNSTSLKATRGPRATSMAARSTQSVSPTPTTMIPTTQRAPVKKEAAAVTIDANDEIDFTAEELFEEIMESLSDAAVPDVDDNDDDFIDRSIKFWFSSPVVGSTDGCPSISPKPMVDTELSQAVVEPENSLSREQFCPASSSEFDDNQVNITDFSYVSPSVVDLGQKVYGELDGTCPLDPEAVCVSPPSTHCSPTWNDTTSPHFIVFIPCDVSHPAGEATSVVRSPTRTECDESTTVPASVAAHHTVVEEAGVDSAVENTLPKSSVKSLLTFFERQSFVQFTSSPSKMAHVDQNDDESDDDFDSVVSANVEDCSCSLNVDIDSCLDGLVNANRQTGDVSRLETAQYNGRSQMTAAVEPPVSTTSISSDIRQHSNYEDIEYSVDGQEQEDVLENVSSIKSESRLETPYSEEDIYEARVIQALESEIDDRNEMIDNEVECGGNEDDLIGLVESDDVARSDATNDDDLKCIHGNGSLMPNTSPSTGQGVVKILSDQLTTQEIVLTVRLPRYQHLSKRTRSDRTKVNSAAVSGTDGQSLAVHSKTVTKLPFRHLHVRRIVRVVDDEETAQSSLTATDDSVTGKIHHHREPELERDERPNAHRVVEKALPVATQPAMLIVASQMSPSNKSTDDALPVLSAIVAGHHSQSTMAAVNVEFDRKARSSAVEYIQNLGGDATNEVSVIREDTIRVVHVPGCNADSVRLPVAPPIGETIDNIALALRRTAPVTSGAKPVGELPANVRVTCEAFERHETLMTSSEMAPHPVGELTKAGADCGPDGNTTVTVIRRTLFPLESDVGQPTYDDVITLSAGDAMTSDCKPTVTSFP